jgi:hypothetical protein
MVLRVVVEDELVGCLPPTGADGPQAAVRSASVASVLPSVIFRDVTSSGRSPAVLLAPAWLPGQPFSM